MAPMVNIGKITAPYGSVDSVHQIPHTGIDFSTPSMTPLHAPIDGVISRIADYGNTNLGKAIFVKTKNGYQYVLGHLSDTSKVKVGQQIHHGDLLAMSGSSGSSTGPHLHYGVYDPAGIPVNPGKIDFSAFTMGGDNMIVKINGTQLNPVMDWINGRADSFIQWESETAVHGLLWGIGGFLKMMSPMIPELAGFAICVLISIGMFTDFAKWFARSLLVFMGGVVWIMLSKV